MPKYFHFAYTYDLPANCQGDTARNPEQMFENWKLGFPIGSVYPPCNEHSKSKKIFLWIRENGKITTNIKKKDLWSWFCYQKHLSAYFSSINVLVSIDLITLHTVFCQRNVFLMVDIDVKFALLSYSCLKLAVWDLKLLEFWCRVQCMVSI